MGSWAMGKAVEGTQVRLLRAIRLDPSIEKCGGTGVQVLNTKNLVTCPGTFDSAPLKVAVCHSGSKLVHVAA